MLTSAPNGILNNFLKSSQWEYTLAVRLIEFGVRLRVIRRSSVRNRYETAAAPAVKSRTSSAGICGACACGQLGSITGAGPRSSNGNVSRIRSWKSAGASVSIRKMRGNRSAATTCSNGARSYTMRGVSGKRESLAGSCRSVGLATAAISAYLDASPYSPESHVHRGSRTHSMWDRGPSQAMSAGFRTGAQLRGFIPANSYVLITYAILT